MTNNPIDVVCPNKRCSAAAGQACTTVGGFVSASPHTPRLAAIVGARGTWDAAASRAANDAYTASVLQLILRRPATAEEIGRAQRDGSLKPERGWIKQLIDETAPRRALPTKRTDAHGTVTLWGTVTHEQQLPSGSYVLQLDSGEVVKLLHNDAWRWAEWWPERKSEAALHLFGAVARYRFTFAKTGQCVSIDFEAAPALTKRTPIHAMPAIDSAQGELL